jgi:tetratricopeptide (TPR) repeat protein
MSKSSNSTTIVFGFLAIAAVAAAWYLLREENDRKNKKTAKQQPNNDDDDLKKPAKPTSRSVPDSTKKPGSKPKDSATTAATTSATVERSLNDRIEELDQKGKALYKAQQFLEAAQVFTEALQLLEQHATTSSSSLSASVTRQRITLRNNRSAMYEKAKELELAKADCYAILEEDVKHTKTRTRLLRILETSHEYQEALVQVCAVQLLYMQENRDLLRQGIPLPTPPVSQGKIEELVAHLLPDQIKPYEKRVKDSSRNKGKNRSLPSDLMIVQLLKSFTGFNTWMAQAAKDGSVESITQQLEQLPTADSSSSNVNTIAAQRASLLLKRGRRHVYDRHFSLACDDFEEGFALAEDNTPVQDLMPAGDYARLLEWVGNVRHWQYDVDSALVCYKKCSDLEPTNVRLIENGRVLSLTHADL